MWTRYIKFLSDTLASVDEANLSRYLRILLLKIRARADISGLATEETYLDWVDMLPSRNEKIKALNKGLDKFPRSCKLWLTRLALATGRVVSRDDMDEDQNDGGDDELAEEKSKKNVSDSNTIEGLFAKALKVVGKGVGGGFANPVAIAERARVWIRYFEWLTVRSDDDHAGGGNNNIDFIERRFKEALGPQELGGSEAEVGVVGLYLNWSFEVGGINRVRTAYDRLIGLRQRDVQFFRVCIGMEERDVLRVAGWGDQGSSSEGGIDGVELVKAVQAGLKLSQVQVAKLRRLHELCCGADQGAVDSWIAYINFELNVVKDVGKATQFHWKASKEVTDLDEFNVKYDEIRKLS
ncbi:hypothetical protein HDU76_003474 [Blyttiomyces sp. JEL0837]|nr:hypothetical protein HDU76_003474 [Blyttiomyces sp. JEL0837]